MKRIIGSVLLIIVMLAQGLLPNLIWAKAGTPAQSDLAGQSIPVSGEKYEVTLITGDVVMVSTMPNGEKGIAISPANSETSQNFWTIEKPTADGKDTYVIPGNVDLTKFDIELFNIDYLIREKYYQLSYLPVMIVAKPDTSAAGKKVINNQVTAIAESSNDYPLFATMSAELTLKNISNAYSTLTGLSNVDKVWLDKKVQVSLSDSVPLIGAPEVWSNGYTGEGVIVAVLDTGIDDTHPDLNDLDDNPATNDPKVLVETNFTDDPTADDGFGHGTHCASIIAGTGATYKGVAPGAWLYNVKVLNHSGWGYNSWIINGIQYATLGPDGIANTGDEADVISMSLGGSGSDGTDPLSLAVNWATSQGVVVAIAAGNSGSNYFTLGAPGVASDVITVGATDKSDYIASFSSRGPTIDYRVKPDVVAPGVNIVAARAAGTSMGSPLNSLYTSASGTSMATPHVAGAAALILNANPVIPLGWTAPKFVKDTLMSNAIDLGYDVYTQGAGRISLPSAANPEILVDPATTSFGNISGNTTYHQTLTFYNLDSVSHELTLTPELTDVTSSTDYSGNASLTTSVFTIPAHGSATTTLAVNTTGLPMGMYRVELRLPLPAAGGRCAAPWLMPWGQWA